MYLQMLVFLHNPSGIWWVEVRWKHPLVEGIVFWLISQFAPLFTSYANVKQTQQWHEYCYSRQNKNRKKVFYVWILCRPIQRMYEASFCVQFSLNLLIRNLIAVFFFVKSCSCSVPISGLAWRNWEDTTLLCRGLRKRVDAGADPGLSVGGWYETLKRRSCQGREREPTKTAWN